MVLPHAPDVDGTWRAVDARRSALADLLDDLGPDEWEAPSLCAGWRVRDVAAHLALAQSGVGTVLVEAVRARGSFDRMVHDGAVRHAARPTTELVARIRSMVGSRRHVLGLTPLEPLVDVLVHGQDIALPLGREHPVPVDEALAALTRVRTMGWPLSRAFPSRRRFDGVELVATDAAWSDGSGERLEGPVDALLLLVTGRGRAVRSRLAGPGLGRVTGLL